MSMLNMPIHVIGAGASGSRIVRELAEKGPGYVSELHIWDGDTVGMENVRAQTYLSKHTGMHKVDALQAQALEWGGMSLKTHAHYVEGPVALSGVVVLCVDSMTRHMQIWRQSIKGNAHVSLMLETRLETAGALIHVVDPCNPKHVRKWEHYWYPDEAASTVGMSCGTATSRGPIASVTASLSVWQLVRFVEIRNGIEDRLDNQIRISMVPLSIETYQW
jgi:hypothetical protein